MDDLSHWDLAEYFKANEAADLVMGMLPERRAALSGTVGYESGIASKITPLLRRMERAYLAGFITIHAAATWGGPAEESLRAFPAEPSELQSDLMEEVRSPGGHHKLSRIIETKTRFEECFFSRNEMRRWLDAQAIESDYSFSVEQPQVRSGAPRSMARRWPWGDHHTELLGHLESAATEFWINMTPKTPKRPHPSLR